MEKDNLYRLIDDESIENLSIDELQCIIEEYPYFQSARLLYTRELLKSDNEQYGEELAKTAVLCADRRKLFYMIYNEEYETLLFPQGRNFQREKGQNRSIT